MNPLFFYSQLLDNSSVLLFGRLSLIDMSQPSFLDVYIATSGLPNHQTYSELSSIGKGCIPPNIMLNLNHYNVINNPIDLKNVKGVEGDFFQITPSEVEVSGCKRGDFGIHYDANIPGSSGCIAVRSLSAWNALLSQMEIFRNKGILTVPLLVHYIRA